MLKKFMVLGGPLVFSQISLTASNFASHYILTSQGPDFLASLGVIGNSQTFMLQVPDSSLYIISNIVSHALGGNELERVGMVFRAGYVVALVINIPQTIFLNMLPVLLRAGNQPMKVVEAISIYAPWYTPGAILATLSIVNKRFLAGIQKQNIILGSVIVSSVVRGVAVYYLVPWSGIKGYAIAEDIYAFVDFAIPFLYLVHLQRTQKNGIKVFQYSFDKKEFLNLLRLGYPLAVKWSVISGMVYYMDFLTGLAGGNALSVAGIVRQYYAWPLSIFVGFSDTVGILASDALAKKEFAQVISAVNIGLKLNMGVAIASSIIFSAAGRQLAELFISSQGTHENNEAIVAMSQSLFYVHIGWLLLDGGRSIFDNFFNGLHKPKTPMWANLMSVPFILVLPYVFDSMVIEGVVGITLGACMASMLETTLLAFMYKREEKELIHQASNLLPSSEGIANSEVMPPINNTNKSYYARLKDRINDSFFKPYSANSNQAENRDDIELLMRRN